MLTHQPIRILGPQFAPAWHRPWFRYIDPVPGAEAGTQTPPAPGAPAPKEENLGFPKDTPLDQMKPEEREAYWKNQSKVQQRIAEAEKRRASAYEQFGTVEELQNAANAAEQARQAALSDADRELEQAKTSAKAEGFAEGTSKVLGSAVKGWLIALTKGANETVEAATSRVEGAIEFADLTKFIGDNGELDAAKVQTFSQSLGSADSNGTQSEAAWGQRFHSDHAGRIPPAPGATGSVASMEQAAYDAMKPKTTA
ncbi:hypothetical protein D8M34_05880 [Microbacterium sp. HSID17254]|uniref:hypothetical protein n=1 Tax=Microbacterium sp. HSID17254 TaxID=2419509 RepID=UPI000F89879D|nr:hypothetical protein [Microbacterium sp. HSID17254]RUQ06998.1 hypothetical protein D8M34_05880 [Microbacterium sp. HSID17254]